MNKKYSFFIGFVLLILCLIAGCGDTQEKPTVIINKDKEQITYEFATVIRGDVVTTARLKADFKQTNYQEVAFENNGKIVSKVYVREGDAVKKGDILVELSSESLENDIERLEYNIARNKLLLGYIDNNEIIDIQSRWLITMYNTANSAADIERTTADVANIKKRNDKQRQSYMDAIELDEKELKSKKKELSQSRIYSSIDGTVYSVKRNLKGATSKSGEVIMTLYDNSEGLFESKSIEYADMFKEGEIYSLAVTTVSFAGIFEVVPYKMSEWSDKLLFSIYSAPDNAVMDVGVFGYMNIVTDIRENVLTLPKGTVYEADGRSYVYVVDENNMRTVKWVTTGMYGDDLIEIKEGLAEGDKVVKR